MLDVVLLHEFLVDVHVRVVRLLARLTHFLRAREGSVGVARPRFPEQTDACVLFLHSAPDVVSEVSQLVL